MRGERIAALLLFLAAAGAVSAQYIPLGPPPPLAKAIPAPPEISDPARRQLTPTPQVIELPSRKSIVSPGWLQHHEENLSEAKAGAYDLVFVGDSITDNYHRSGPDPDQVFKPTWDKYFAPHHALNLGVSGDSTQHVLWRLEHGEVDGLAPSNIVLLIGTNNTWHDPKASAADVAGGIEAVVDALHKRMPKARILLLAILPTMVSAEKSAKDQAINRSVSTFYGNSSFVYTLDLKDLFLNPDGSLNQALFYDMQAPCKGSACAANAPPPPRTVVHPNTEGQRLMAEAVSKALFER